MVPPHAVLARPRAGSSVDLRIAILQAVDVLGRLGPGQRCREFLVSLTRERVEVALLRLRHVFVTGHPVVWAPAQRIVSGGATLADRGAPCLLFARCLVSKVAVRIRPRIGNGFDATP